MKLNLLVNNPGSKKTSKRVGRGIGCGKGKTCGRGVKGQKSRSGVAINGFEGGQTSLIKRLSKRGFNSLNPTKYKVVKLEELVMFAEANKLGENEIITKEHLVRAGFIKNVNSLVKLLSCDRGAIERKLNIKLDKYSAAAKNIVEQAGGEIL